MKFLPLIAATFLATSTHAQDQKLIDAATAYTNGPAHQELLDTMTSPSGVMTLMGFVNGGRPPDNINIMARIVSEELSSIRPAMESAVMAGMINNFTVEEIEALNAFYSSPVGASAMTKMTPLMGQIISTLGPEIGTMQGNLVRRIQADIFQ